MGWFSGCTGGTWACGIWAAAPLGATFAGSWATATGLPGSSCRESSPITTAPVFGSKRTTMLTSFWDPPTSSHGSHTLYEWPIFDLL